MYFGSLDSNMWTKSPLDAQVRHFSKMAADFGAKIGNQLKATYRVEFGVDQYVIGAVDFKYIIFKAVHPIITSKT